MVKSKSKQKQKQKQSQIQNVVVNVHSKVQRSRKATTTQRQTAVPQQQEQQKQYAGLPAGAYLGLQSANNAQLLNSLQATLTSLHQQNNRHNQLYNAPALPAAAPQQGYQAANIVPPPPHQPQLIPRPQPPPQLQPPPPVAVPVPSQPVFQTPKHLNNPPAYRPPLSQQQQQVQQPQSILKNVPSTSKKVRIQEMSPSPLPAPPLSAPPFSSQSPTTPPLPQVLTPKSQESQPSSKSKSKIKKKSPIQFVIETDDDESEDFQTPLPPPPPTARKKSAVIERIPPPEGVVFEYNRNGTIKKTTKGWRNLPDELKQQYILEETAVRPVLAKPMPEEKEDDPPEGNRISNLLSKQRLHGHTKMPAEGDSPTQRLIDTFKSVTTPPGMKGRLQIAPEIPGGAASDNELVDAKLHKKPTTSIPKQTVIPLNNPPDETDTDYFGDDHKEVFPGWA